MQTQYLSRDRKAYQIIIDIVPSIKIVRNA